MSQQVDIRSRATAIILQDDTILMIHRISFGKEFYVFPGGGIEAGETPEQAVVREIREESGLQVEVMGHMGELPLPEINQYMYVLRCEIVGNREPIWRESKK